MTSTDVRSILDLPNAASSSSTPARKPVNSARRPDGISRELYALIGDNAPYLAEARATSANVRYRERPKTSRKRVTWEWIGFSPLSQDTPHRLAHWVRTTDDDPQASIDYFSKFNEHGPSVMEYSQVEYDSHLHDPDWTPHETTYLFNLLQTYDLRFVITADRYAYKGSKDMDALKYRTVEDIKDRYFTICRRLVRTRTATDAQSQQQLLQAYSFDKAREIKRKQYASELFHLTTAEIAEEEALYVEIKRMEQNERQYRSDRDNLMRTIIGLDSGLIPVELMVDEAIWGVDKKRRRPEDELLTESISVPLTKKQKDSAASDTALCIYRVPPSADSINASHLAARHPVHQPAFIRSSRLALPRPNAAIRITELLTEMGISSQRLVMPSRENVDLFEGLLSAANALVDMKRQVDRVEQELRTLTAQKQGFVLPLDKRTGRSESVTSTATSATGRRSRQP